MSNVINQLFGVPYVINLKSDTERLEKFTREAEKINLEWRRFPAMGYDELIADGYIGPKLDMNVPYVQGFVGRLGCALSHRRAVEQSMNNQEQTCCVIEDDATFVDDLDVHLRGILSTLPNDWNMMYVSCGLEAGSREKVNDDWYWIGTGFWGWWCYGFRNPEAMRVYLRYHRAVAGQHFDTAFRTLGFGEPGTGIRAYRPVRRLVSHTSAKGDSRTNFKTQRGVRGGMHLVNEE